MNKVLKKIAGIALAAAMCVVMTGCIVGNRYLGTWYAVDDYGHEATMTFDRSGVVTDETGRGYEYTVTDGAVVINVGFLSASYRITSEGTLVMVGHEGTVYYRTEGEAIEAYQARVAAKQAELERKKAEAKAAYEEYIAIAMEQIAGSWYAESVAGKPTDSYYAEAKYYLTIDEEGNWTYREERMVRCSYAPRFNEDTVKTQTGKIVFEYNKDLTAYSPYEMRIRVVADDGELAPDGLTINITQNPHDWSLDTWAVHWTRVE